MIETKINDLTIVEISDYNELIPFRDQWNELVAESRKPRTWLRFEWLATWWQCLGEGNRKLFVLLVKDEEKIIGIAPLMIVKEYFCAFRIRKIEFISMAQYADSPSNISPSLEIIISKRYEDVLNVIMLYVVSQKNRWDIIRLNPIPEDSPTIKVFNQYAETTNHKFLCKEIYSNVIIEIDTDWQTYYSKLSKNFRKSLTIARRKMDELGEIKFEFLSSEDEMKSIYPVIMDIEKRSWKWNKGVSLNSTSFRDFFECFALVGSQNGLIKIGLLKVNNKYIAYDYNIISLNRLINLKGSYDIQYHKYSPGTLLLAFEIEQSLLNGMRSINLLWDLTESKQRWEPTTESHDEIFLFNKTLYAWLLNILYFGFSLYRIRRQFIEYRNRVFRKLNIRLKNSELTRIDQL